MALCKLRSAGSASAAFRLAGTLPGFPDRCEPKANRKNQPGQTVMSRYASRIAPEGAADGRDVAEGSLDAGEAGVTRSGGISSDDGPIGAAKADNDAALIMQSAITNMT